MLPGGFLKFDPFPWMFLELGCYFEPEPLIKQEVFQPGVVFFINKYIKVSCRAHPSVAVELFRIRESFKKRVFDIIFVKIIEYGYGFTFQNRIFKGDSAGIFLPVIEHLHGDIKVCACFAAVLKEKRG